MTLIELRTESGVKKAEKAERQESGLRNANLKA